jgi:hypothetical protein
MRFQGVANNCKNGREDRCCFVVLIQREKQHKEGDTMIRIRKKIIVPHRVRQVTGSFGFIPHRFMTEGFWASLGGNELLLYLFLVMVADSNGLSYYGSKKICSLLHLSDEEYIDARDRLIARDLIALPLMTSCFKSWNYQQSRCDIYPKNAADKECTAPSNSKRR